VGCCGFAGDRGFTHPELNAAALAGLRAALPAGCDRGYSTSRTCEIGLSLHAGIPYQSIVYLVDRCTEPLAATPSAQPPPRRKIAPSGGSVSASECGRPCDATGAASTRPKLPQPEPP